MSRLLESLRKAQKERAQVLSDDVRGQEMPLPIVPVERRRFWTGALLLLLVIALLFAGFVLLQFALNGIEPSYWWERFLMAFSAMLNTLSNG